MERVIGLNKAQLGIMLILGHNKSFISRESHWE